MNRKRIITLLIVLAVVALGVLLCAAAPGLVEVIKRMHGG